MSYAVGLGKTIFNSGICIIPDDHYQEVQIILTERLDRKKNSGAWPELPLKSIDGSLVDIAGVAQNRDVQTVLEFENYLNSRYPFLERIKHLGLERFLDSHCHTINHHLAHAYSASLFSPFTKTLTLVIDGAGSAHQEGYEFLTLFEFDNQKIEMLDKKFTHFNDRGFSQSIGLFYEGISEFIFNSKTLAGKVMGLAPLGKSQGVVEDFPSFLENLDWSKKFSGKTKEDWENSPHLELYKNLAATVQESFEFYLFSYLEEVSKNYPKRNLILTGGCALNCTFNGKLWKTQLFKNIYIPPNPGDEGISLGCAWSEVKNKEGWQPLASHLQTSARGMKRTYSLEMISAVFHNYKISSYQLDNVGELLKEGEVIAWYQGRSEVGPRALGHRSILALPKTGIKNYLNQFIKFRESFRPYGCTVIQDEVSTYFEVDKSFENPFMSFAIPIRPNYREELKDIGHIDGTSRFQTLHREQNHRFYDLLKKVGELTGIPILLNTSLNVMGEPILETLEDAFRFMENSQIKYLVFNDYLIEKGKPHV